jgi:hypothetical protein
MHLLLLLHLRNDRVINTMVDDLIKAPLARSVVDHPAGIITNRLTQGYDRYLVNTLSHYKLLTVVYGQPSIDVDVHDNLTLNAGIICISLALHISQITYRHSAKLLHGY